MISETSDAAVTGDATITGLTADSRAVRPGFLFAALPGSKADGTQFIDDAIRRGAAAVLVPAGHAVTGLPAVTAQNPRRCFALAAAAFYGAQPATVAAVTGTNGKSSTVNFCRQMWAGLNYSAAALGTIGIEAQLNDGRRITRPGLLTTPDPVALHAAVADLAAEGVTHLALEASSIGLDQYRMDGLRLTTAAFTNLTRDHLDYHGTMAAYGAAKRRLFAELLPQDGTAAVMHGSAAAQDIIDTCRARGIRTITVGGKGCDIAQLSRRALAGGQYLELEIFGQHLALELPLVGAFQADNALLALALVMADTPALDAAAALERLLPVRGRLELAATLKNGAAVYVDYAHTPDGLETLLTSLRPHAKGKLHVVFGCGGDRDRGKRPMMGEIAARLADHVIVTDDNPRSEDPAAIRADVMAGCPVARNIGGRREAIAAAIAALQPGDVLAVAGKGHEQGQTIGQETLPFDDVTEVRRAVEEKAA